MASPKGFKEESDLVFQFYTIELILGAGGVGKKVERDHPDGEDVSAPPQEVKDPVRRRM